MSGPAVGVDALSQAVLLRSALLLPLALSPRGRGRGSTRAGDRHADSLLLVLDTSRAIWPFEIARDVFDGLLAMCVHSRLSRGLAHLVPRRIRHLRHLTLALTLVLAQALTLALDRHRDMTLALHSWLVNGL